MSLSIGERIYRRILRVIPPRRDRNFLPLLRGVIHVGANVGQERRRYDAWRLPVLWVEPIPEVFATLLANIADYPDQRAARALVADVAGNEVDFYVSNNRGESSSMLDLAEHKDIWPTVGYERTLRLTTTTLVDVVRDVGLDMDRYNGLVMDTQGSELLVLKGAVALLSRFDFVKVEVADFESYKGCCQLPELAAFMTAQGFTEFSRRLFATRAQGGSYYDVIYRRDGAASPRA